MTGGSHFLEKKPPQLLQERDKHGDFGHNFEQDSQLVACYFTIAWNFGKPKSMLISDS